MLTRVLIIEFSDLKFVKKLLMASQLARRINFKLNQKKSTYFRKVLNIVSVKILRFKRSESQAIAVHSISISNDMGQEPTAANVRAGGFEEKYSE